ncbi:helicase [Candidatus Oscillochloris fontis]|uniref:helicase n=1 Tax=Candidatus Oscillochloris fontis TaxID=2496868 RepID=UPI00101D9DBD|nr:helicase [Candidatus Oscillochloris fontis]
MATDILEVLHNLARQRSRGEVNPLLALRHLPQRPGTRISHLSINQRLAQAWIGLTGQPFRQHQSLSVSALRRGEPFLLVGGGANLRQTLHLLALELLHGDQPATALLLVPDEAAATLHLAELRRLTATLAPPLPVAAAQGEHVRAAFHARLVVTTPTALHERMLRHHDRAWLGFWSRLQLVLIADAHRYTGVAAAHLTSLLLRTQRLTATAMSPFFGASVVDTQQAHAVLELCLGRQWRMIPVDDVPRPRVSLALWRVGTDRLRETVEMALGLQRAGLAVHLLTSDLETPLFRTVLGSDVRGVSVGRSLQDASVVILTGVMVGPAALREAIESGAQVIIQILADDPTERTLLRLALREPAHLPWLDDPAPVWLAAPANAYVLAQHLLCAASERPITATEVEAWQVASIMNRLEAHQQLTQLPDHEPTWQPLSSATDPYSDFDLCAAGVPATRILDERGQTLTMLDSASFDRWAFADAALPPVRGGYRVIARDDQELQLTLRLALDDRRTFPLRHCQVRVRDCRARRMLHGCEVAWGRVMIDEEIYAYREVVGAAPALDFNLNPPLATSWGAPALWIDLPLTMKPLGQMIGWSLAFALNLRTLLGLTDLVPAYDAEAQRLYLVDAQPGGNGLALWLYTQLEDLLPLAYDIALDSRSDTLLEPLARVDMDWMLALLGGWHTPPPQRQAFSEPRNVEPEPPVLPTPPLQVAPKLVAYVPAPPTEPAVQVPAPPAPPAVQVPAPPAPPAVQVPAPPAEPAKRPPKPRGRRVPDPEPPALPAAQVPAPPAEPAKRPPKPRGRRVPDPEPPVAPPATPKPRGRRVAPPEPPAVPEAAPPPPPPPEPLPDAAAMVARLRRMREQREQHRPPPVALPVAPSAPGPPRFHAGDQIFCTPWGFGEVRSSRFDHDRELLVVHFPDYGALTIDTTVSLVRRIEAEEQPDEEI